MICDLQCATEKAERKKTGSAVLEVSPARPLECGVLKDKDGWRACGSVYGIVKVQ